MAALKKKIKILAIETSCDETAIALVEAEGDLNSTIEGLKFKIIADALASQIKLHKEFGGVVPMLAKREHIKNLPILFKKVVTQAAKEKVSIKDIDFITVTVGPGLEPALWTGINFAQELSKEIKKPLFGTNHLTGHLYSFLVSKKQKVKSKKQETLFPAIGLIVSGGHTILLKMDSLEKYKKLGETCDDAVGEAFDKVARLLDLPYPGGPEIEKIAKLGDKNAHEFPRPMLGQKNYDFSYSGLKTSVLYHLRDLKNQNKKVNKADVAASFQKAAFDVLIKKTIKAVEEFGAKSILVSGGVSANKTLHKEFKEALKKQFSPVKSSLREFNGAGLTMPQYIVTDFTTDNALMIAASGYVDYLRGKKYKIVANGNLSI